MSAQIFRLDDYRRVPRRSVTHERAIEKHSNINSRIIDRCRINPAHNHHSFDAGEPNAFMRQWLQKEKIIERENLILSIWE